MRNPPFGGLRWCDGFDFWRDHGCSPLTALCDLIRLCLSGTIRGLHFGSRLVFRLWRGPTSAVGGLGHYSQPLGYPPRRLVWHACGLRCRDGFEFCARDSGLRAGDGGLRRCDSALDFLPLEIARGGLRWCDGFIVSCAWNLPIGAVLFGSISAPRPQDSMNPPPMAS